MICPMRNARGNKTVNHLMLLFRVQVSCLLGAPDWTSTAYSQKVVNGGREGPLVRRKHKAVLTV